MVQLVGNRGFRAQNRPFWPATDRAVAEKGRVLSKMARNEKARNMLGRRNSLKREPIGETASSRDPGTPNSGVFGPEIRVFGAKSGQKPGFRGQNGTQNPGFLAGF